MGIWVFAIACAAFLLTLTAFAAAALCRAGSRLWFWAALVLWWLCAGGVSCAIASKEWFSVHQEFSYPSYVPHLLFMVLATVLGIPVLAVRARLKLFGRPDGENWPLLPLLGACCVLLIVNVAMIGELDAAARSLARMARPQVDSAYLKLLGPDPAEADNAAELYRQAFLLCRQTIEAADSEARQSSLESATTAPVDAEKRSLLLPSPMLGDPAYAQSPQLLALVARLQPVIRLAHQAAVKPSCRMEKITEAPTISRPLPYLAGFRQVATTLYSDALVAVHDGRTENALSDLIVLRRLEQHVQQSDRREFPLLVSLEIGQLANHAIAAVLPSMAVVPANAQWLIRDDSAIKADVLVGLRGEELATTATLLDLAEGKLDANISGMGRAAGLYRVLYLASDLDAARLLFDAARAPIEDRKVDVRWLDVEHAPMSMPAKRLIPPLSLLTRSKCPEYLATTRCASLCIALTQYRLAHGNYPTALDELVPTYIAAIPSDPFDDKPLRYRVEGGAAVVYSIGSDLRDDGGKISSPTGAPRAAEDIGLELKLPDSPSAR